MDWLTWAALGLDVGVVSLGVAVELASLTEGARARARRRNRVTDNRHPATENDPGRGSATAEKP